MSQRIKATDFIGHTFNELTVKDVIKKNGRSYCICQCSCGAMTTVAFNNLRSGNTKTCGNRAFHPIHPPYKDLTGQRFGKLTALEITSDRSDRRVKWKCQCDCGNIVNIRSSYLISGHTQSCGCIKSKGEEKIAQLLLQKNIPFKMEYWFENCRFIDSNYPAKFDFYVNNQYLIEYDGIQHYKPMGKWGKNFNYIQEHDIIKTKYCFDNNIPLIRIPYTHYDNLCIEDLLLDTSKYIVKKEDYNAE